MCATIALVAAGLGAAQRALLGVDIFEPIVLAILIGIGVRYVIGSLGTFELGTSVASKAVLEWSVVLLGASVQFGAILGPGFALPVTIVILVVASLFVSYAIGRRVGLSQNLAVLVAVGNSICGNSAIAAVAPVIKAQRHEVASAMALTAVLGVGLVLTLPLSMAIFLLDQFQFGVLAGMSVYSVPQVVAATLGVGVVASEVAALVKLTRVIPLGPLVVAIALMAGRDGTSDRMSISIVRYIPWFVVGFVVLGVLRSIGLIPDSVAMASREAARWAAVFAMAGLGLGVELAVVRSVGPRVAIAVVASLAFMVVATLSAILIVGLR